MPQFALRPERPTHTRSGTHFIEDIEDLLLDKRELARRLLARFSEADYRPPVLPAVALHLLKLSQDPNAVAGDIASLLQEDPLLAGRVLKLMGSAYYSGRQPITSLKQAVVRMGLSSLRDIVMEAAVHQRVFRAKGYEQVMARIARHSQATARIAHLICRYTALHEDYAFLCGLLHDMGLAGLLLALADGERQPPDLELLWPAIDQAHAEASEKLAELWGLPGDLAMIIGHHHSFRIDGFVHPLAATLCLAETVANAVGASVVPLSASEKALGAPGTLVDQSRVDLVELAIESLGLSPQAMKLIEEGSRKALREIPGLG